MSSAPVRVVLVGAGPRGTGVLARLSALGSSNDNGFSIDVVDPSFAHPVPPDVRTHRTTAVDVTGDDAGPQSVALASGACPLEADVVLLAQGRPGTRPTPEQEALADFADWHGLRYRRPRAGDRLDLGDIPAGVDLLIRDTGAPTGDLVSLLTLGRGGHYAFGTYRRSGAEPRIHLLPPSRPAWTDGAPLGAWEQRRAALVRAGVAVRHPDPAPVRPDARRRAFLFGDVASRTLIEPDTAHGPLRASADPLIRTLAERGELAGWSGTGALLDRHGHAHPRRFAIGGLTGGTGLPLAELRGAPVPVAV